MLANLKIYLFTSTAKDSYIMLAGTLVATFLGFLLTLILARNLEPLEFGLLITALTFTQLVLDGSELGVNPALINFIAKSGEGKEKVFLNATFALKLIAALSVSIAVFFFSLPISQLIFRNEAIAPYIQISSLGILFLAIAGWGQTFFQAKRRFFLAMISSVSVNFIRLLAVFIILTLGLFSGFNAYLIINLAVVATIIFIAITVNWSFLTLKVNLSKLKEVFVFGFPVGLSFSLAALYTRLDQIMVFNFLGEKEAGIYGLAFRVVSFLSFASASIGSVIAPRFVSLHPDDFMAYFKKTFLVVSGLAAASVLAIPLSSLFFPLLFGSKFEQSVPVFQILTIGIVFFTLGAPFNSAILYRFKKTKFSLIVAIISLIAIWTLLTIFIPLFETRGAALAVTIVYVFQFFASLAYFLYLRKRSL